MSRPRAPPSSSQATNQRRHHAHGPRAVPVGPRQVLDRFAESLQRGEGQLDRSGMTSSSLSYLGK